ncbi:MAG: NlpC/P60 family protein [Roseburia sp.]|uniref:C40 family peptidase n=1 Tax=Roseburia sp. 831b TaxID=1261635 RepID=UPI000951A314|nr:C40 family peptidase [Roseburia sp. 831b]MCI5920413.1 NlpC/P60 family protein [Roseburia sp.]MDD6216681.1 NlpC/P60 family protein [Roseburia sp.]WVK74055.1 NlpC/P60 family protein [Roseburia sp. 831b]
MKSNYSKAISAVVIGALVVSAACISNQEKDRNKNQDASVTAGVSSEFANVSLNQNVASGVALSLASNIENLPLTATVSETDTVVTAAGQEENAESAENTENTQDTTICGYTNLGIASVEGNLNVREQATTDSDIVGKMQGDAACEILEVDGEWTKISSGNVTGYVSSEFLLTGDAARARAAEIETTVAKVNTTTLYVREATNTDCRIVALVGTGEELEVLEALDGWYKVSVDDEEGYISADYVEVSEQLPKAQTITELKYGQGISDVRVSVVSYATQFVGNPYVWGGTSLTKGADCSGFTMSVMANYGVYLPHSSKAQANCGTRVSASEAQPGDLFFYGSGKSINHVAIYIGNGQIVHASNKKTGIKISNAFYRSPICVVRVLGD